MAEVVVVAAAVVAAVAVGNNPGTAAWGCTAQRHHSAPTAMWLLLAYSRLLGKAGVLGQLHSAEAKQGLVQHSELSAFIPDFTRHQLCEIWHKHITFQLCLVLLETNQTLTNYNFTQF